MKLRAACASTAGVSGQPGIEPKEAHSARRRLLLKGLTAVTGACAGLGVVGTNAAAAPMPPKWHPSHAGAARAALPPALVSASGLAFPWEQSPALRQAWYEYHRAGLQRLGGPRQLAELVPPGPRPTQADIERERMHRGPYPALPDAPSAAELAWLAHSGTVAHEA